MVVFSGIPRSKLPGNALTPEFTVRSANDIEVTIQENDRPHCARRLDQFFSISSIVIFTESHRDGRSYPPSSTKTMGTSALVRMLRTMPWMPS